MRSSWRRHAVLSLALVAAACGGGDDATPEADPGPNPTLADPGPNDTSNAPDTLQGLLRLDPATSCVALELEGGTRLALTLEGYTIGDDGAPALVAAETGNALAHEGDQLVVTGTRTGAPPDACGEPFSGTLNSVLPPP